MSCVWIVMDGKAVQRRRLESRILIFKMAAASPILRLLPC